MNNKVIISEELQAMGCDLLKYKEDRKTYAVPEGYFRNFADDMTAMIRSIDTPVLLPAATKQTPFDLPEDYFTHLSGTITRKAKATEIVTLQGIMPWTDTDKQTPFVLPENYFAQFEQNLFHHLFHTEPSVQDEIGTLSPLLADLKQESPYQVPAGYFPEPTIQPRVKEHPAARSIKWARWAAAACILVIFGLGGWQMFNPLKEIIPPTLEQQLTRVPEEKIKNWLANNIDEMDINSLSSNIARSEITAHSSLSHFSDEDIQEYLEAETW